MQVNRNPRSAEPMPGLSEKAKKMLTQKRNHITITPRESWAKEQAKVKAKI